MSQEKQVVPVYSSWATVTNALDSLSQGVPPKIDRSLFPGLNWAVQSRLLSGFRFLKLVDADHNSTPLLVSLAEEKDRRKENWKAILADAYRDILSGVDLKKTSPNQLSEAFDKYGLSADTRVRAVRFFLQASLFVGAELSPHLKKQTVASRVRRRVAVPLKRVSFSAVGTETPPSVTTQIGTSKRITLRTGGHLELSVSVNLFDLTSDDRQFVFDLIDRLTTYEKDSAKAETPGAGTPGETANDGRNATK